MAFQNAITATTGVDSLQGLNFNLSSVPNYQELQALFDYWKLVKISYRFRVYKSPDTNAAAGATSATLYPVIFHTVDYNDSAAPASALAVCEYPAANTTVLTDSKPVSEWFTFKPKCSLQIASAGFASGSPWLDTATTAALYNGLKFAATQLQTGINVAIDWKYTLHLKNCK